jgi:hypothetical protein
MQSALKKFIATVDADFDCYLRKSRSGSGWINEDVVSAACYIELALRIPLKSGI